MISRVVRLFPLLFVSLAGSAVAQMPPLDIAVPQLPKLVVGEPAPSLGAARWVKGTPVKSLGGGKVTVIEFFASWCPTCRETYARMSELARKYRGKATFLGVSVWENPPDVRDGSYVRKVKAFAVGLGDEMPYSVAVDDPEASLASSWLGPTSYDIPKAFVVNRQGEIAWCGHPLADLDEAVGDVVSGHFDLTRAMEQSAAQIAALQELIGLVKPIEEALRAKDFPTAVRSIGIAVAKKPSLEESLGPTKFLLLLRFDEPAAYAYARELAAGPCRECSPELNQISWAIVDDDAHLKAPDYATALAIAKQAFHLVNRRDPYVADTLAYALFKSGDKAQALDLEIKAVHLAESAQGIDPKTLKELRERLALIRKASSPPPI